MTRDEALDIKADLDAQGYDTSIVTFDDGKCGVAIKTKGGPSVGIAEANLLELGLEIVKQLS